MFRSPIKAHTAAHLTYRHELLTVVTLALMLFVAPVRVALASWAPDSAHVSRAVAGACQYGLLAGAPRAMRVPILMYHHLSPLAANAPSELRTWTVEPQAFELQMAYLSANGFQTLALADLRSYFAGDCSLPDKPVVLTFDDGWADAYSEAFRVLREHGQVGTFFVITDSVGHSKSILTWPQVEEMSRSGMEIGSHTKTHPYLLRISTVEAWRQLTDSKSVLEKHLGITIDSFAYPFGDYNQSVIDLVGKAGYETAVGISGGSEQSSVNQLTLHRTGITSSTSLASFAAILQSHPSPAAPPTASSGSRQPAASPVPARAPNRR